jgi:hypothetical protein
MAKASPAAEKSINGRIAPRAGVALATAGPALVRGGHAEAQPGFSVPPICQKNREAMRLLALRAPNAGAILVLDMSLPCPAAGIA